MHRVAIFVLTFIFIAACSDGSNPLSSSAIPDINGVWIADTDFAVEKNTCPIPDAVFELRAVGRSLNIWQDTNNPAKIFIGQNLVLEGELKPDGSFKTVSFEAETHVQHPEGRSLVKQWWEGKFTGDRVRVSWMAVITPPSNAVCEVVTTVTGTRTASF